MFNVNRSHFIINGIVRNSIKNQLVKPNSLLFELKNNTKILAKIISKPFAHQHGRPQGVTILGFCKGNDPKRH